MEVVAVGDEEVVKDVEVVVVGCCVAVVVVVVAVVVVAVVVAVELVMDGVNVARKQGQADERAETAVFGPQLAR